MWLEQVMLADDKRVRKCFVCRHGQDRCLSSFERVVLVAASQDWSVPRESALLLGPPRPRARCTEEKAALVTLPTESKSRCWPPWPQHWRERTAELQDVKANLATEILDGVSPERLTRFEVDLGSCPQDAGRRPGGGGGLGQLLGCSAHGELVSNAHFLEALVRACGQELLR
eukprot:gb/GFBE01025731.1/.p1 GENE.gb/GFBE01025731.1/~~gb/GFBE01025731.1/.p1  ORF type:complete len:172 (+),score=24.87 gb/GFBE01025731.1/:1-516(+)